MKTKQVIELNPIFRVALFFIPGIATGVSAYHYIPITIWITVLAIGIIACPFTFKRNVLQSYIVLVLMFISGATCGCLKRSNVELTFPNSHISYQAVIASHPIIKGKTVRCDLIITDRNVKPFKVKAYIEHNKYAERLKTGDGIEATSILKQPDTFSEQGFDYRRYLLFHGFSGTTYIRSCRWHGCEVNADRLSAIEILKLKALMLRERCLKQYAGLGLSGQDYAVLAAMTLGYKAEIDGDLNDDYSVSGAAHVLALSGLHLGIIFAVLTAVFSRLRIRSISIVTIMLVIWIYVFVVGMAPSVMRSAVMLSVYSAVKLLHRDNMPLNTLSIAALILLTADPLTLYDVGFQMSFIAVLFIILFYRPLYLIIPQKWRKIKIVDRLWQMTAVSVTAQLGVAPLVTLYFGRVSCYFLLANMWVIPLATLILYFAILLVLASPIHVLQTYIAFLLGRLTHWLNAGVSFIASWPGASVDGIRINALQTSLIYVMIALVCMSAYVLRHKLWPIRRSSHNITL